jgi:hypothetical protein
MILGIKILATSGFIFLSALIDAEHLKDKDYIESHISRGFLRLIFIIIIGLDNWIHGVAAALLFAATFDQVLNLLMKRDLFYLGNTAYWDKFFNKRKPLYMAVKFITLALGIILITI